MFKRLLLALAILPSLLLADLPSKKQDAKDLIYAITYSLLPVYTDQVDRYRALYYSDATALSAGQAVLDALDASYADYAAQIDACTTEEEVDDILGTYETPPAP